MPKLGRSKTFFLNNFPSQNPISGEEQLVFEYISKIYHHIPALKHDHKACLMLTIKHQKLPALKNDHKACLMLKTKHQKLPFSDVLQEVLLKIPHNSHENTCGGIIFVNLLKSWVSINLLVSRIFLSTFPIFFSRFCLSKSYCFLRN